MAPAPNDTDPILPCDVPGRERHTCGKEDFLRTLCPACDHETAEHTRALLRGIVKAFAAGERKGSAPSDERLSVASLVALRAQMTRRVADKDRGPVADWQIQEWADQLDALASSGVETLETVLRRALTIGSASTIRAWLDTTCGAARSPETTQ